MDEQTQYDILELHYNLEGTKPIWWSLTRVENGKQLDKTPSVVITPSNYNHFIKMGEQGYLIGQAKKIYEDMEWNL
jgi:hypothetical protein